MNNFVEVISVEDDNGEIVVELQRSEEIVKCSGIELWDEPTNQKDLNNLFEEWLDYALSGEEGYSYYLLSDEDD